MQKEYYIFGGIYIFVVFGLIASLLYLYNYTKVQYIWCFGIFAVLELLLLCMVLYDIKTFSRVFIMMKKLHNFEYKRNKNIMLG